MVSKEFRVFATILNDDLSVRELYTEELTFEFLETFLVLQCLLPLFSDTLHFHPLTLFLHIAVVLRLEVTGAYIFWTVQVFMEIVKQFYIVAPQTCILDGVSVADGYLDRCPKGVCFALVSRCKVLEKAVLPRFEYGFYLVACQQGDEQVKRMQIVKFTFKTSLSDFGQYLACRIIG